jgi:hypothetical protein
MVWDGKERRKRNLEEALRKHLLKLQREYEAKARAATPPPPKPRDKTTSR